MIANDDDDAVVLDDPDGMRAYDISANKRKDKKKIRQHHHTRASGKGEGYAIRREEA